MRDVARRAGVSVATVSHIINRTRPVSEDLRRDVVDAMAELNYRPNLLARGLRSGQSKTLGMIVPDNDNPFFAEVARGVEDTSFEHGYSVILCNSEADPDKEQRYVDLLVEKQVDGIIFVAAGMSAERLLASLRASRVPVVVTDRDTAGVTADSLGIDNRLGGYLATAHLLELGHTAIGCIAGPHHGTPSGERVTGYVEALDASGVPADGDLILRGDWQCEGGYASARELLASPHPPTAIFACNDMMAIGAISAAVDVGLRVPADLSIVGFDDVGLASFANPALTTVAQPKYEAGAEAVSLLMERIGAPQLPPRRELLDVELIVRASSTAPRLVAQRHAAETRLSHTDQGGCMA